MQNNLMSLHIHMLLMCFIELSRFIERKTPSINQQDKESDNVHYIHNTVGEIIIYK